MTVTLPTGWGPDLPFSLCLVAVGNFTGLLPWTDVRFGTCPSSALSARTQRHMPCCGPGFILPDPGVDAFIPLLTSLPLILPRAFTDPLR